MEDDRSAVIAEELGKQGQRADVEIYKGREGLPVWKGTSEMSGRTVSNTGKTPGGTPRKCKKRAAGERCDKYSSSI